MQEPAKQLNRRFQNLSERYVETVGRDGSGTGAGRVSGTNKQVGNVGRIRERTAEGFVTDSEVITLAARLLVVAAIFQLFDGFQVVGSGALRGLSDVRIPAVISFIAYWLLAIPGGYFLGVHGPLGATGIWIALAAGLAVAAVLLVWRFMRLTAKRSTR